MSETNGRPGLLRMAGALIRAPFEERMLREDQARLERLSIQVAESQMQEVVRRVQPDPDEISLLLSDSGRRELDPESSRELQKRAIEASLRDGHCVGYLRSLQRFVIGKGPTIGPVIVEEGKQPKPGQVTQKQADAMAEVWESFKRVNDWEHMEDELPLRLWRDGEFFLRKFVQTREGPPENWQPSTKALQRLRKDGVTVVQSRLRPESVPAGTVHFRFIPPDQIQDPSGDISHGILTAADDVCTVLGYCWAPNDGTTRPRIKELIPASEIRHAKIRVDQDVKRGRSILEPLLKRVKQYDDWLEYRLRLNLVRTAHTLFKKVTGASNSQVTAIRDGQRTTRETGLNDRKARMVKGGTTVTHGGGIEYEFKGPNLQAQDAQHDGRALALSMAVPTGLPEYMFTGDASNANFSSTMVAESPGVREFEDWQDTCETEYAWVYRTVMAASVEHGSLKGVLTPEEVDALLVAVIYQPMIARDELDHTQANAIRHRDGVLSREGWAEDEGIDWEREKERLDAEREEDIEFGAVVPPMPAEDEGDDE